MTLPSAAESGTIPRGTVVLAVAVLTVAACGDQRTGVHVIARVANLSYDELRFGITTLETPATGGGGDQVVVDPTTRGRYVGPFADGDQDVYIYLSDALAGAVVRCDVDALLATAPVAHGSANVTIERREMKDVEVVLLGEGTGGAGGTAGTSGTAGTAGTSGTAGVDGAGGQAGAGMPPGKAANGGACAADGDCMSGHCVEGLCCENACNMVCKSCALPDSPGLCRPVAEGTTCSAAACADEKNTVGAGTCTAMGMCMTPKKTMCRDGQSCVDGICQ